MNNNAENEGLQYNDSEDFVYDWHYNLVKSLLLYNI